MAKQAEELRTDKDVFRLPEPKKGERLYFDKGAEKDRAKGLALRVRRNSRIWTYYYRSPEGKSRQYPIGPATSNDNGWTLAKARSEAHALRVKVDAGNDPLAERQTTRANKRAAETALTVADLIGPYLKAMEATMRPRSIEECSRHLNMHAKPLHGLLANAVELVDVAQCLNKIESKSGPVARNRVRSTLSAMFAWSIREGSCKTNPVIGTNKAPEIARDRVLSDAELVAIWNAATPDSFYGRIVRMLMLTGQRRDEIGGLWWAEIKREQKLIELPSERTKNKRPHIVPLSDMALELLPPKGTGTVFGEGSGGYSAWSGGKERLDAKLGPDMKPWTLHDLRRTVATGMAELGVQPHVVEALLNHISGHKGGIAGVYNRASYFPEKQKAIEIWTTHLRTILAKAEGANVVALHSA